MYTAISSYWKPRSKQLNPVSLETWPCTIQVTEKLAADLRIRAQHSLYENKNDAMFTATQALVQCIEQSFTIAYSREWLTSYPFWYNKIRALWWINADSESCNLLSWFDNRFGFKPLHLYLPDIKDSGPFLLSLLSSVFSQICGIKDLIT